MNILFGDKSAEQIYKNLTIKNNISPKFCIIQVGDNAASSLYIKFKINVAKTLNFDYIYKKFERNISLFCLIEFIDKLNKDITINGIIIQLPLPNHLISIIQYIAPEKDIDGLTKLQQANLYLNEDGLYSCTALGIINLLKYYKINISGKKVSVIGRSSLVGKPLSLLFMHNNALVSIIHSQINEEAQKKELLQSDIICSAIGVPHFLKPDMIKSGVILIDVGCCSINNKIYGDIDPLCYQKALAYTPMPKGVGPMTIAMLMFNVHKAYLKQNNF